jgi:putative lipoprotein
MSWSVAFSRGIRHAPAAVLSVLVLVLGACKSTHGERHTSANAPVAGGVKQEERLLQFDSGSEAVTNAPSGDRALRTRPEDAASMRASIQGAATYHERIMLPAEAVFEATLEDVSRADAAALVLGRTRIENPGNPPIRFNIGYDPIRIDPRHTYVVRARIVVRDRLWFTTDTSHSVLTAGGGSEVEVLLRRSGDGAAEYAESTAPLENTYWKLTRLSAAPVEAAINQREPHLLLHPDDQRVSGSGGCNALAGTYATQGARIAFSRMAGTLMACRSGMEQERSFHEALGASRVKDSSCPMRQGRLSRSSSPVT